MKTRTLQLPHPAAELFETVYPALHDFVRPVTPGNIVGRLGGGTALAAQWGHRRSTDIDITVPEGTGLIEYLGRILDGDVPAEDDEAEWDRLLRNLEFVTGPFEHPMATVNGCLLFGTDPRRLVPQSGIRAICYAGDEPDYTTRADEAIGGAMVPLHMRNGMTMESGLVDLAWDFVRRNTVPSAHLDGMRRIDRWEYPETAVREALANAVVHRDYSIAGTDIMLMIFSDRLEVQSPGRLPNTVTPDGMKLGLRYARNQTLVNVMRDYGYVDARGMGVRNRIIPTMRAHNGTAPDLIAEEHRFTVRLWKYGPDGPR